ncbi:hypothetical protein [Microbacterium sp. 179-I 3D3 NHS]|uniref:hypothetical protein n=1 Tax=Microbacterium sp. 179-I 3D3 NHS TaxID=3142382 RepID=UPI0039A0A1E7
MTSDSDDALRWEGDETAASRSSAASRTPRPAPGRAAEAVDSGSGQRATDEVAGISTGMLLLIGVVAGVYLLYTLGWVVGGLRLRPLASFLVADAMFLPWFVLAIAAPALWFLASWLLTRARPVWVRVVALLAGVILLVPWPFVTVGVIGS